MATASEKQHLLLIDDELDYHNSEVAVFSENGYQVTVLRLADKKIPPVSKVHQMIRKISPVLILCDYDFKGEENQPNGEARNGLDLARDLFEIHPEVPIVMYTSYISLAIHKALSDDSSFLAHASIKDEALTNPRKLIKDLRDIIKRHNEVKQKTTLRIGLKDKLVRRHFPLTISTKSKNSEVRGFFRRILELAETNEPVLFSGEPGSGKELFARALHFSSKRCNSAFVAVESGLTHNSDEMRSWLFGRLDASFTGVEGRASAIWKMGDGTILINDLFATPFSSQQMLLALFEQKPIELVVRKGSKLIQKTAELKCRMVATVNPIDKPDTNNTTEQWRKHGARKDLYDRLTVLEVPSWRDRPEDIPQAIQDNFAVGFLNRFSDIDPQPEVPDLWDSMVLAGLKEMIIGNQVLQNGRTFQRIGEQIAARMGAPNQTIFLRDIKDIISAEIKRLGSEDQELEQELKRIPSAPKTIKETSPSEPVFRFLEMIDEARVKLNETEDHISSRALARILNEKTDELNSGKVPTTRPDMYFPGQIWKLSEYDCRFLSRSFEQRIEVLEIIKNLYNRSLYRNWIDKAINDAKQRKNRSKKKT